MENTARILGVIRPAEFETPPSSWNRPTYVRRRRGRVPFKDDGGFDFDAHVARLMEASAKETGLRARTAEDNLDTKGLVRVKRLEDEDDEESEGDEDGGSDASGQLDESLLEGLNLGDPEATGGGAGEEGDDSRGQERAVVDAQFEGVSRCPASLFV